MRNAEQKEADAQLSAAMERVARAYGWVPDDATVVEFVGVVEAIRYGEDPDEFEEFHFLTFRDGTARKSVGVGLLAIGSDLISNGELVEEGGSPDD